MVSLTVNGKVDNVDADPDTPLLWALRVWVGLTGTKYGCGIAQCGACTVLVNGRRINSCLTLAIMQDGAEVTTIEGLGRDGELHPLQRAFHEQHGLQCGYCTPGMIMAALSLIEEHGALDDDAIRAGLEGNLCRCTGYQNIVAAVRAASAELAGAKS